MWSALMNGSGLHGAGAGGGYVPAPGWEFVPCTRMERSGRGRTRNPLRRVSSPPAVCSHSYEQDSRDAGESEEPHMWSSPEPQQSQHSRLRKKLEDLRRRHVQDKDEWTKEKESLLREVADIQGGENRRILLDLKTVLEEVQAELKREEEKRSELQLQYTTDRCAWEQEKAELKCRIVQLEARETRETVGLLSGGAGPGFVARGQRGETSTPHRERGEQRRSLVDPGMELRRRPELDDRDWSREKEELLEKFDVERREWENQLKDMQRKIEELYCEVRTKREGIRREGGRHEEEEEVNLLSVRSTSSRGSSSLSDIPTCEEHSLASEERLYRPSPARVRESPDDVTDITGRSRNHDVEPPPGDRVDQSDQVSPERSDLSYRSMKKKKKNTTALNAALKEIARVSEELCSYQEEIRRKSGDKRSPPETLQVQRELDGSETRLELEETSYDLSQIYSDLQALGRESWFALSPENSVEHGAPRRLWRRNSSDPDGDTSPGAHSDVDAAPPVPPRTTSWNLSHQEPELHIPESPPARKCHSPCVLVDRKCSSPSIVRKFEAMLQENEGKVLIDGVMRSCSAPSNSNCNQSCCHNRWSCDAGKLSSGSRPASYTAVQKSFSEVNILSAGKDFSGSLGVSRSDDTKAPVEQLLSSLEFSPASLQGSRRNMTLEQKTAEFNRTLFQAEMGRGVQEDDSQDGCPLQRQPSLSDAPASDGLLFPGESKFQPHCAGVASRESRRSRCDPEVEEFRIMQEFLSDFPDGDSGDELGDGNVELKVGTSDTELDFCKNTLPVHSLMEFGQGVRARSAPEVQPKPEPSRLMNEHPWKPLTLAAYPRPEGSRSNYGAVEKILKNYESAARAQQNQSPKLKQKLTELNILEIQPLRLPSALTHLYLQDKDFSLQGPEGWNT